MYRFLYKNLLDWKIKPERKPLVLFGARQTGKTWLLKEFGKKEYKNTAYINCENNPVLSGAFEDYDTRRLMVCYPSSRQLKKRKVFGIWINLQIFFCLASRILCSACPQNTELRLRSKACSAPLTRLRA